MQAGPDTRLDRSERDAHFRGDAQIGHPVKETQLDGDAFGCREVVECNAYSPCLRIRYHPVLERFVEREVCRDLRLRVTRALTEHVETGVARDAPQPRNERSAPEGGRIRPYLQKDRLDEVLSRRVIAQQVQPDSKDHSMMSLV